MWAQISIKSFEWGHENQILTWQQVVVKTDDDDDDDDSSLEFSNATSSYGSSVTRLGDLLGFGQVFKAFGNN